MTVQNRIRKNQSQHVVISGVRFPNEIKFIKDHGGLLIKISRGQQPVWYETAVLANKGNSIAKAAMNKTYSDAHFSEWAIAGTTIDVEFHNDSSLEHLHSQIKEYIDKTLT